MEGLQREKRTTALAGRGGGSGDEGGGKKEAWKHKILKRVINSDRYSSLSRFSRIL